MLQGFPVETAVIPVQKPTPKLEGFVSEAAQLPSQRIQLQKSLGDFLSASAPQQPRKWLLDVGAPAVALLAPIAVVLVVLVSSRPSPATALSPSARRGTDIALPAAPVRPEPKLPTQAVATSFTPEVRQPDTTDVPSRVPTEVRLKPDTAGANGPSPSYERVELPIAEPAPPVVPQALPVIAVTDTNTSLETLAVVPPPERLQALATPVNTIADEQPAILAAINRYQAAYENLDATAAKKVWPTVNERALAKAFGELESQTLTFEPCQIDVTGSRARASCPGYARYVGRVGKTRNEQRRDWTFVLQKSNESWHIDAVQSR